MGVLVVIGYLQWSAFQQCIANLDEVLEWQQRVIEMLITERLTDVGQSRGAPSPPGERAGGVGESSDKRPT